MKLAEALSLRKSLDSKVGQLAEMLNKSSWGYQGVEPKGAPSFQETDRAITDTLHRLQDLIERINLTNIQTTLTIEGESMTIMQAIARRDILGRKIGMLRQAMQSMLNALQPSSRGWFERGEETPKIVVTAVPVKDLEERIDKLVAMHRALDAAIQAKGWETEIL